MIIDNNFEFINNYYYSTRLDKFKKSLYYSTSPQLIIATLTLTKILKK